MTSLLLTEDELSCRFEFFKAVDRRRHLSREGYSPFEYCYPYVSRQGDVDAAARLADARELNVPAPHFEV